MAPPAPPPPPSAPVRAGGDIKEPKRIHYVEPTYPTIAKQAKVSGMVIIEATIGKDGSVRDAKVLRPAPLLDEAALAAVKQWKYTPTTLGGVPVEVLLIVTVNFTLK
jgi:protein TonB